MSREEFGSMSALLVDDNSYMRRIIRTLLNGFGIRSVYECENVDEALRQAQRDLPSLVITDWNMPHRNGLDLVHFLRDETASPNPFVPIILLTAYTERQLIVSAAKSGVNEILSKPISATALYRRIHSIVYNPRPFVRTSSYFGPEPRGPLPQSTQTVPFKVLNLTTIETEEAATGYRKDDKSSDNTFMI